LYVSNSTIFCSPIDKIYLNDRKVCLLRLYINTNPILCSWSVYMISPQHGRQYVRYSSSWTQLITFILSDITYLSMIPVNYFLAFSFSYCLY
jgi:hypothetical protein